ncbi:MAG: D-alanine--D-alanine ligase [Pelotomaculum sp.]|uniref:D-alanine--D-alanine ligase n=1 Tax=Pelotomaculum thermopropionicum (strain DSM 13744 / JCM 10971 / SI) TaxID=370438 RepID=DDL_PELTS|nr:RecName: Full=D-alanine--D-alanine ligase; AltName: Full=D-Ala-D-Ala ligase; AltName: Full=D-alanylalanine synthetase [Pelotomaculum thermopropionicum SI]NPV73767.1 D-alanine--D-alanine ligase [Pelotomaculum sp.]BAF59571.1 D-alanine-D-alanine ligase and related ATP-grasp enzymes [Pelotomaculum thermopropionicum SI]
MTLKVGVLMGGRSSEREVSLKTGEAVYNALKVKNYLAVKIDVGLDVVERIKEERIDLAFIALHGRYGEDGTIQGLLEMLDIPYTGSGVLASALAMDKAATKKIIQYEGLPTPPFMLVEKKEALKESLQACSERICREMGLPLVVKAPTQGSTIGMSFVHKEEDMAGALELAYDYDPVALVEQFIRGTEVTASILGNEEPVALPLIEIVSATGVYDYKAKYTAGMSDHIIPPRIPEKQQNAIKKLAVSTFKSLGCRGLARVDFIVDKQGNPFILEVNTIPGMTATSLFPDAARAAGIEFPDLIEKLVELAMENCGIRRR